MSPWVLVLLLILVVLFLIMAVRGIRDLYIWYSEGRDFSRVQRRAKVERQQRKAAKQSMPALKERPPEPPKSGIHTIKPPDKAGH